MKLQFKEQKFQIDAVNAIIDCFIGQPLKTDRFTLERSKDLIKKAKQASIGQISSGLENEVFESIGYRNSLVKITDNHVLKNIQDVQRHNDLFESQKIERPNGLSTGYNLTIDMETGTGKTYTYIRTMYELHKHYGWSKFIVIVPSIAIREGVYKSFQETQDHFQMLYGHKIKPFIYNSSKPQDIENFASDSRISVMIINTQAFNARGADARRIYKELDQFGTRKPIDIIAQTNPIIIIDEPQSVEGKKTMQSMRDFNSIFTLRYSATHKTDYNKVYILDAFLLLLIFLTYFSLSLSDVYQKSLTWSWIVVPVSENLISKERISSLGHTVASQLMKSFTVTNSFIFLFSLIILIQ